MKKISDFERIIKTAWSQFDDSKTIIAVDDVSARVSTNHVFKVSFAERSPVYAKLSYYGKYEHFKEDHVIINNLANNLESPYENFLARGLMKNNKVFIYRYRENCHDTWVIFYNPIQIRKNMPRRLDEKHIVKMGSELALFHKACMNVRRTLPESSKTLLTDINTLSEMVTSFERPEYEGYGNYIIKQCDIFQRNIKLLEYEKFDNIPVFVDWNIGNFSVATENKFFSRWDYDWFRVAPRLLDFYFFSRVCSDIGDRTVFSYWPSTMMEERFILFLKSYHKVFPLSYNEVLFIKEAYRFFILNYVVKDGRYFFHDIYANKLQKEAYELYLPSLDEDFNADILLKALKLK